MLQATRNQVGSVEPAKLQLCYAVVLVRIGSARHREPLVLGGHERSASANQRRRSEAIHRYDLGRRSSPALGSNPTSSASTTSGFGESYDRGARVCGRQSAMTGLGGRAEHLVAVEHLAGRPVPARGQ
jgi:hypothetical protein